MRWTEARGREVLDTTTAQTVGTLDMLVIDPDRAAITALVVDDDIIEWSDAGGIGRDAVTISDGNVRRDPQQPREQAAADGTADPVDKLVLTDDGFALGTLVDLEIDAESGTLLALHCAHEGRYQRLEGQRLMGIGSYAVVVTGTEDHRADGADRSDTTDDASTDDASTDDSSTNDAETASADELHDRTKDELYQMARSREVPGRSKMTKAELVDALSS